jgi:hypothetical protein
LTLVQSSIKPFFQDAQYREIDIAVKEGQSYLFRVAVNAIARQDRKKEVPICPEAWLQRRDFGAKFSIESVAHVPGSGQSKSTDGTPHTVYMNKFNLAGRLIVKDPMKLKEAILSGVGRCKAWGCGLLSVLET